MKHLLPALVALLAGGILYAVLLWPLPTVLSTATAEGTFALVDATTARSWRALGLAGAQAKRLP